MKDFRGSRKHVLEWVRSAEFLSELNSAIAISGAVVSPEDVMQPNAESDAEAQLSSFGRAAFHDFDWNQLDTWWLKNKRGAKTPTWDFIAACTVEGRRGLVLIEAKANVPEFSSFAKPFPKGKKLPDGQHAPPSRQAVENHEHIGAAIDEARTSLGEVLPGIAISRDKSYQFSNRIAFAWKLAQLGIPTVLLYVGFTNDTGISYVGDPFEDETHWSGTFVDYIRPLFPVAHLKERISYGTAAPFWLLENARSAKSPTRRPDRPKKGGMDRRELDGR